MKIYFRYKQFSAIEIGLHKQVQDLQEIIDRRAAEHSFDDFTKKPITSAKAQELIEKLRSL